MCETCETIEEMQLYMKIDEMTMDELRFGNALVQNNDNNEMKRMMYIFNQNDPFVLRDNIGMMDSENKLNHFVLAVYEYIKKVMRKSIIHDIDCRSMSYFSINNFSCVVYKKSAFYTNDEYLNKRCYKILTHVIANNDLDSSIFADISLLNRKKIIAYHKKHAWDGDETNIFNNLLNNLAIILRFNDGHYTYNVRTVLKNSDELYPYNHDYEMINALKQQVTQKDNNGFLDTIVKYFPKPGLNYFTTDYDMVYANIYFRFIHNLLSCAIAEKSTMIVMKYLPSMVADILEYNRF
jgi:hypothetical protein